MWSWKSRQDSRCRARRFSRWTGESGTDGVREVAVFVRRWECSELWRLCPERRVLRDVERISPGDFVRGGDAVRLRFGVRSLSDGGGVGGPAMPVCAVTVSTLPDPADRRCTPPVRSKERQTGGL